MGTKTVPHILLVDSYDSFTHNLAALCRRAIPGCSIHIIKNDALSLRQLIPILPHFSAIIVGPGPGSPDVSSDIGLVRELWHLSDEHIIPIFGVCLGLQSLATEFEGQIKRLNSVKHGQISRLKHDGTGLFKGVSEIHVVRYHSLHVVLKDGGPIEQLASADDGHENGSQVVMAIKHEDRPFWAVQFHPESCNTGGGLDILRNFWRLSTAWHTYRERVPKPWTPDAEQLVGPVWPQPIPPLSPPASHPLLPVQFTALHLPNLSIAHLCEQIGAIDDASPFALLESAALPGQFSIIGCIDPDSPQITYHIGSDAVEISRDTSRVTEALDMHDVWSWLASYMRNKIAVNGPSDVPFWGGLIGYLGYELGVHRLTDRVPARKGSSRRRHPDVNLIYVERSIVIDHRTETVYVQSLKSSDRQWIADTVSIVQGSSSDSRQFLSPVNRTIFTKAPSVRLPDETLYKARIAAAKEHLLAGDSYELCLTAHTHVKTYPQPSPSSSWDLYKLLQTRNPAPHSGYLRLHPTTLLSSSPERFLSFSRPPDVRCQLRPIKGTVRKAPGITREIAEGLLARNNKEVAENLMIVDLIRHDLHGVVGDDVVVKQFCRVEEYETVWQLVSVIEGGFAHEPPAGRETELGWEVLRSSLPPGSMTGAPKKRSVEILQTLEDHDRSIYSGVSGYWCAGGGGDWSVVIRSCFKYDDRNESGRCATPGADSFDDRPDEWVIGAGGAITALSDTQAEWEEMTVKLQSVLQTFSAGAPNDTI